MSSKHSSIFWIDFQKINLSCSKVKIFSSTVLYIKSETFLQPYLTQTKNYRFLENSRKTVRKYQAQEKYVKQVEEFFVKKVCEISTQNGPNYGVSNLNSICVMSHFGEAMALLYLL